MLLRKGVVSSCTCKLFHYLAEGCSVGIALCHSGKQSLESDSRPSQAQGLWRMLQGKPKDEREEQAQRAKRERQEKLKIDDEWASRGKSGKLCT